MGGPLRGERLEGIEMMLRARVRGCCMGAVLCGASARRAAATCPPPGGEAEWVSDEAVNNNSQGLRALPHCTSRGSASASA